MMRKKCSKCGTEKTLDEFQSNGRQPPGLRSECRVCNWAMRNLPGLRVTTAAPIDVESNETLYPPEEWFQRNLARVLQLEDGPYLQAYYRGIRLVRGPAMAAAVRYAALHSKQAVPA